MNTYASSNLYYPFRFLASLINVLLLPFIAFYEYLTTPKIDYKNLDSMDKKQFVELCENNKFANFEMCKESINYLSNMNLETRLLTSNLFEINSKLSEKFPKIITDSETYKTAKKSHGRKMKQASFELASSFKEELKKYDDDVPSLFGDKPKVIVPFDTSPITKIELINTLSNETGGKDFMGITKSSLKFLPSYMHDKIVYHYRNMLEGKLDSRLCVGKSIFFFKNKGEESDIKNYRRITSIPNLLNTFHKILNNRLTSHLKANQFFDTTVQKAGMPGLSHGIFEQIYKVKSVIKHANKNKKPCSVLFLDIKSAFDNIDRKAVFHVLNHYSVDPKLIDYVRNFYNELDYFVVGSNKSSELRKWNNGLLQGCSLSPLLFTLCMNYILEFVNKTSFKSNSYKFDEKEGNGVLTLAYMDDVAITCNSFESLEEVFSDIKEIFESFGLEISINKCAMMVINEDVKELKSLKNIPIVAQATYLGDTISCTGDYKKNYEEIKKEIYGRLLELKDIDEEYRDNRFRKLIHVFKRSLSRMYDVEGEDLGKLVYTLNEHLSDLGLDTAGVDFNVAEHLNYVLETSSDSVVKNIPNSVNKLKNSKPIKPSKVDLEDLKLSYQSIKKDDMSLNKDLNLEQAIRELREEKKLLETNPCFTTEDTVHNNSDLSKDFDDNNDDNNYNDDNGDNDDNDDFDDDSDDDSDDDF